MKSKKSSRGILLMQAVLGLWLMVGLLYTLIFVLGDVVHGKHLCGMRCRMLATAAQSVELLAPARQQGVTIAQTQYQDVGLMLANPVADMPGADEYQVVLPYAV